LLEEDIVIIAGGR